MNELNNEDNGSLSQPKESSECDPGSKALDTQQYLASQQIDETNLPQVEGMGEQILRTIEGLVAEFASLNRIVESRLKYDEVKEEAFERLYRELDSLKNNTAFDQIRPLFIDLILLYDRIDGVHQDTDWETLAKSSPSDLLQTFGDELLEILSRREIEQIRAADLSFDPSIQRAIGTQPTSAGVEDNQVDRVVRKGFIYRGHILRAEEVIVKKYSAESSSKSSSAPLNQPLDCSGDQDMVTEDTSTGP